MSSHSFRKWFRTKLAMSGIPQDVIEYFLGHKQSVYVRLHEMPLEELRELYAKADLTVMRKVDAREAAKEAIKATLKSLDIEVDDDQISALLENKRSSRGYREIAEKLHEALIRDVLSRLDKTR